MVTIRDIAKKSGFSVSTVSRALSGSELIPPISKGKIGQIAREMGYIPNAAAKSLKTSKAWNVGVLSLIDQKYGFSHYLFARILDSFIAFMNASNYEIALLSKNLLEDSANLVGHCKGRNLDGVLVFCADMTNFQLQELAKSDIPIVVIDGFDERLCEKTYCISSNNRQMMFDLTTHVIDKGHSDIVYVCGEDFYVTQERVKGFKTALKERGLEFCDSMLIKSKYYDLDSAEEALLKILNRKKLPSCIMMSDDYVALKAYDLLRTHKIEIGKDISIVGFDGLEIASHLQPKLTTASQNTKALGETAAQTLLSAIHKKTPPYMQLIEAKLVEAESVVKKFD